MQSGEIDSNGNKWSLIFTHKNSVYSGVVWPDFSSDGGDKNMYTYIIIHGGTPECEYDGNEQHVILTLVHNTSEYVCQTTRSYPGSAMCRTNVFIPKMS